MEGEDGGDGKGTQAIEGWLIREAVLVCACCVDLILDGGEFQVRPGSLSNAGPREGC